MAESPRPHDFVAPEPEEIAKFLPAYEVQAFIAKGGMGAVYMARQKSLDRQVAIKILPSHIGGDAYLRSQFESEAKNMAKLNHPNVVSVHDFGEYCDQPYIVMEMVRGKSLYHSARGKKVDARQAGRIVRDICHGLAHAHEQGILHRDLKPANVLLDPNRTPKIGDFGLARHIKDWATDKAYGTPGYTAPEVAGNPEAVGEAADIYSVGVILYELLTGELPVKPYEPATTLANCDPAFDQLILKAIDSNPVLRYQSAKEMAKAIDRVIQQDAPMPVANRIKPVVISAVPMAKIVQTTRQVEVRPASLQMAKIIPEPAVSSHSPESAPKKLIVGPISKGQTRYAAVPSTTGSGIISGDKMLYAGLLMLVLVILTIPLDWFRPVMEQLYDLLPLNDKAEEKTELIAIDPNVKAYLHDVELVGQKGNTGLVNLDGEKVLDWSVLSGASTGGDKDKMPAGSCFLYVSTKGRYNEAKKNDIPVFFEAGGKEYAPSVNTSNKMGAKPGNGWYIIIRAPKQTKGSILVNLYMLQEWCGFDVEVTLPNKEKVPFSVSALDAGVTHIPLEIPNVKGGKFYVVKITASKDTAGDFAMGLNAVVVEAR
jgi:serine/threonine protein kinase